MASAAAKRYARAVFEVASREGRGEEWARQLGALRAIDMVITSSLDLRVTLDVILDRVTADNDYQATFHLKRPQPAFLLLRRRLRYLRRGGRRCGGRCKW